MIRSTLFAGAACLTVSACSDGDATVSEVPDTEAEKTAMATEIANMMSDPAMMDQMFSAETMAASVPDMSAMCTTVPAGEIAACNQRMETSKAAIQELQVEMMDKARAMTPQMMQDMGAIMARTYTGEELAAMHSFYSSPEGKSILQKQPQVMAEFMPAVMQRMQPLQLEMVQELSERMNASAVTTPNLVVPGATPSTTVPGATVTPPPPTSTPPTMSTTPTTPPASTLPRPN